MAGSSYHSFAMQHCTHRPQRQREAQSSPQLLREVVVAGWSRRDGLEADFGYRVHRDRFALPSPCRPLPLHPLVFCWAFHFTFLTAHCTFSVSFSHAGLDDGSCGGVCGGGVELQDLVHPEVHPLDDVPAVVEHPPDVLCVHCAREVRIAMVSRVLFRVRPRGLLRNL